MVALVGHYHFMSKSKHPSLHIDPSLSLVNRIMEEWLRKFRHLEEPPLNLSFFVPKASSCAVSIATQEISQWASHPQKCQTLSQVLSVNTSTLQIQTHALIRQPQCPVCADKQFFSNPKPSSITLRRESCLPDHSGGYRIRRAEDTWAHCQKQISPITGIVRKLERITSDKDPFHTYIAEFNYPASPQSTLDFLRRRARSASSGKGITKTQAKVSALCEAIERFSGMRQGDEPVVKARMSDLPGPAIHPQDCLLFSEKQYRDRETINKNCFRFHYVPEPFDPSAVNEWTAVWSLTHSKFKYLPTDYCYYPQFYNAPKCLADTNGTAAGNSMEEAILQGFLELVERDCVAIGWYNCLRKPKVDLESFRFDANDPPFRRHS